MADFQDHLRTTLLVDGKRQLEVNKQNLKLASNNQPVETFEGLVGKTPGSGRTTVSATAAIPASGPEFDYWTECVKGTYHTIQVPLGTKSFIGNGWFDDVEIDQSVNGAAEISFTWIGAFTALK